MICIDTNVVIAVINQQSPHLIQRFRHALVQENIALSSIVLFELHYGIANSARRDENAERLAIFLQAPIAVLTFDTEDAGEAGSLRAELKRAGTPIGAYDLLIAAQARRRHATLVTADNGEFTRVPGLVTEDWSVAQATDRTQDPRLPG